MIDALELNAVPMEAKPDPTHVFGEWGSTIVSCASSDRFGRVRRCTNCQCIEVFAGGAGSHYWEDEAQQPCVRHPNLAP